MVKLNSKYVRITDLVGQYKFTPLKGGKTRIDLQVKAHPGGIIPISVVNIAAIRTPYETLRNIKKLNLKSETFTPSCSSGFDLLGYTCKK